MSSKAPHHVKPRKLKYTEIPESDGEQPDDFAADAEACSNENDGEVYEPHTYAASASSSKKQRVCHPIADDDDDDEEEEQQQPQQQEEEQDEQDDDSSDEEQGNMADVDDGQSYRQSLTFDSGNPSLRNIKGIINSDEMYDVEEEEMPSKRERHAIVYKCMKSVVAGIKQQVSKPASTTTWLKYYSQSGFFERLTNMINIAFDKSNRFKWRTTNDEVKEVFEKHEDSPNINGDQGDSCMKDNGAIMDADEHEDEEDEYDKGFINDGEIPIEPKGSEAGWSTKKRATNPPKTSSDVARHRRCIKEPVDDDDDDDDDVDDGVAEGEGVSTLDYAASTLPTPAKATFNQSVPSAFKHEPDNHMNTNQWTGSQRKINGVSVPVKPKVAIAPAVKPVVVAPKVTPAAVKPKPVAKPVAKPVEEEEEDAPKAKKERGPPSRNKNSFENHTAKTAFESITYELGARFIFLLKEYQLTHVGASVHTCSAPSNWKANWKLNQKRLVVSLNGSDKFIDETAPEINANQYSTCMEIPEAGHDTDGPPVYVHFLLVSGHVPRRITLLLEKKIWDKTPSEEKKATQKTARMHNNLMRVTVKGKNTVRMIMGQRAFELHSIDYNKENKRPADAENVDDAPAAAAAKPIVVAPPAKRAKTGAGTFGLSAPELMANFQFGIDYEDSHINTVVNKERLKKLGRQLEAVYETCSQDPMPQQAALLKLVTVFKTANVNPIQLALDFVFLLSPAYKAKLESSSD